ncbi:LysR family transcriptional regulator [Dyella sp. 20L07]|uniref:LysR family transcriptional regulator n=1 Tax=Dyella sp. 20L07 TaxID=3384240 RepID=UPI003D2C8E58
MDLQALTDFALVATHGGFGRASRMSGRSKATLSRRVTELEQSLGVRLIERGSQSLRLTDEGKALYERTRGPLSDIAEAEDAVTLGASVPRGRLRVSAPLVLAHVALGRVSARFALAYPDVQLEVVADDRKVDPVEDGFDLVIRVDPSLDERLVGRRILDDQRWVVAHPEVARPALAIDDASVPEVSAVLSTRITPDLIWRYRTVEGSEVTMKPVAALRLSSLQMVRDAVLVGAGAALLPKLLVTEDVRAGRLALWGTDTQPPVEIWVLRNSRGLVGAKVRAFLDMLTDAFPDRTFVPAG